MSQQTQQPDGNYPYQPDTSTLAVLSLISGILAWLGLFGLGGLVAVITGHMAVSEINKSMGRLTGSGMAKAGLILGYVNIALAFLGICLIILVIVLGLSLTPVIAYPFLNHGF